MDSDRAIREMEESIKLVNDIEKLTRELMHVARGCRTCDDLRRTLTGGSERRV